MPHILLVAHPVTLFFCDLLSLSSISWTAEIDWFGNGIYVYFLLLLFSFLSLLFFFLSFLLVCRGRHRCRYERGRATHS